LPSSFFRGSAVFGLMKVQQFKRFNRNIDRTIDTLLKLQQEEVKKFEATGPFVPYKDMRQLYDDVAAVWFRSSVLIDQIARENNMEYYHFLQPNQYVKGSKVLTEAEKRQAYSERTKTSQAAIIGYPILIQQGRKLLARHIKFFDATRVFANEKETVYLDICCHYNELGKEILATYMMDNMVRNPRIKPFLKELQPVP